jgi:hypothetical protein
MSEAIERLNKILDGWTESRPGGLICNPREGGAIIDSEILSGLWFVIFNDDRPTLTDLPTRDDAVTAFILARARELTPLTQLYSVDYDLQPDLEGVAR